MIRPAVTLNTVARKTGKLAARNTRRDAAGAVRRVDRRPEAAPATDNHLRPTLTPGADWQPCVLPKSARQRVFLNGEPVSGAVAASVADGWVDVSRGYFRGDARYRHDQPEVLDDLMGRTVKRLRGTVTLVGCRE